MPLLPNSGGGGGGRWPPCTPLSASLVAGRASHSHSHSQITSPVSVLLGQTLSRLGASKPRESRASIWRILQGFVNCKGKGSHYGVLPISAFKSSF